MALWQGRKGRKPSGGRLRLSRKKRRFEVGTEAQPTYLGEERMVNVRTLGGGEKTKMFATNVANVIDPATNKGQKAKIITVKENPANPHYVQRNIINKGATIQTEIGLAKVTSRPGKDGCVNAVLIK
ncbi:MAG: 30S ribosomal protein S8e [Methanomassiliicoccales archaeon]|nr:30S ribosomal protein S8e [Methanomassiliicoccales archaeon]